MGFWKNIQGIWDPNARLESVIETQVLSFRAFMYEYRERDPNAWLGAALKSRVGARLSEIKGGPPDSWYFAQTAPFSVLSIEEAPIVLGIDIFREENPGIAGLGSKCSELFFRYLAPVRALQQTGALIERWRELNPWTAANLPSVGQALADCGRKVFGPAREVLSRACPSCGHSSLRRQAMTRNGWIIGCGECHYSFEVTDGEGLYYPR